LLLWISAFPALLLEKGRVSNRQDRIAKQQLVQIYLFSEPFEVTLLCQKQQKRMSKI
jgi:hypothetical protein